MSRSARVSGGPTAGNAGSAGGRIASHGSGTEAVGAMVYGSRHAGRGISLLRSPSEWASVPTASTDVPASIREGFALTRRASYGVYLRSPHWRRERQRQLGRDGFRCQRCGGTRHLEVHHLTYARLGSERPGDLTTLCRGCHGAIHTALDPGRGSHSTKGERANPSRSRAAGRQERKAMDAQVAAAINRLEGG